MKSKLFLSIMLVIACSVTLQSQVIIVDSLPDYTPENDQLYLAANWYHYQCGHTDLAMHKNQDDKWEITLVPPVSTYIAIRYWFNRGSIQTIERDSLNHAFQQRLFLFSPEDTIRVKIHNWYDNPNKPSTAASNVIRLTDNFPMPEFDKTRGIELYLPPDYDVSDNSYPVMYMHDGENLFDEFASLNLAEWKVDETLNDLAAEGYDVPIVVAIGNDYHNRLWELSPWGYEYIGFIDGQGDKYIDFIANTLKPHIDSVYRTLPGRESTCIMGSSLGGLISYYGAFKRPDVFGKAGIFSPSYQISDSIWNFIRDADKIHPMRLYQLIGSEENENMVDLVMGMHEVLSGMGFSKDEISSKVVEGGKHEPSLWCPEFREAYLWLFPEANTTSVNRISHKELSVFPNPASNMLYIETPLITDDLEFQIYNLNGAEVLSRQTLFNNRVNVSSLPKGLYFLKIRGQDTEYLAKFIKE